MQNSSRFLGADGKYHSQGSFLGTDGCYPLPSAFFGVDGKYHPRGGFLGVHGSYVESESWETEEKRNQGNVNA